MTRDTLSAEISRLRTAWAAGDPADAGLRRELEAGLEALRAVYRTQPEAFEAEEVRMLRDVSAALRSAPRELAIESVLGELKETFGYDSFRPGQQAIVEAGLTGRACVGVMPTGAGKSLTYQLPARLLDRKSPRLSSSHRYL